MRKLNLLDSFPHPKRNVEKGWRTEENKLIAKRYDKEFFDGERVNGYGGYYYDGRWQSIAKKMQEIYGINSDSSVLDIGCAKGFLLHDLQEMIPGIKVAGIDVSSYALSHALEGMARYHVKRGIDKNNARNNEIRARRNLLPRLIRGSAESLPWMDNSFDVVLSINTSHNLPISKLKKAISEMTRVCRPNGHKFIQVDAYSSEEEYERMKNWVLTAETMLHVDGWTKLFQECKYDGDYFWTTL